MGYQVLDEWTGELRWEYECVDCHAILEEKDACIDEFGEARCEEHDAEHRLQVARDNADCKDRLQPE